MVGWMGWLRQDSIWKKIRGKIHLFKINHVSLLCRNACLIDDGDSFLMTGGYDRYSILSSVRGLLEMKKKLYQKSEEILDRKITRFDSL